VKTVNFTEGSIVKKGDTLLTIDPSIFQSQLDNATAMLSRPGQAQGFRSHPAIGAKQPEAGGRGSPSGGISPEELDIARYTVAQDQAAIGQDQASIAAARPPKKPPPNTSAGAR